MVKKGSAVGSEDGLASEAAFVRGEAAGGDGLASVVGRIGAAGPAVSVQEVEEDVEEDMLREAREGAERAGVVKGRNGPGVRRAVVRAQGCEGAGRAQVGISIRP